MATKQTQQQAATETAEQKQAARVQLETVGWVRRTKSGSGYIVKMKTGEAFWFSAKPGTDKKGNAFSSLKRLPARPEGEPEPEEHAAPASGMPF